LLGASPQTPFIVYKEVYRKTDRRFKHGGIFYAKIGVEYENLVKDIPVFSSDLQNTALCVIINLHICMQIREVE